MRHSAFFWIGILVMVAACEPAAKQTAPSMTSPRFVADINYPKPVLKEIALKPALAVVNEARARARADSLHLFASALAQVDTTVEGESFCKGDLDGNGEPDYLVLARSKRPCDEASEESYCRKVFIMLNGGAASLRVVAVNEGLVGCTDCGGAGVGDPFQQFIMRKGLFTVTQLYGACQKTELVSTFKYDPARHEWMLLARDTSDYSCQDDSAKVVAKHEDPRQFGQVKFADASGL